MNIVLADDNLLAYIIQYLPVQVFKSPPAHAWRAAAIRIIDAANDKFVNKPASIVDCKLIRTVTGKFIFRSTYPIFARMTMDMARRWPDRINWLALSKRIPFKLVGPVADHVDWTIIASRITKPNIGFSSPIRLSRAVLDFVLIYADRLGWKNICSKIALPMDVIWANVAKVNIAAICKFQHLDDDFIRKFADQLDWRVMSPRIVKEPLIREFAGRLDWSKLDYGKISEELIRDFPDKFNWRRLCKHVTLSDDFMREFADRLDWPCVSKYQWFGKRFAREFANRIDWHAQCKCGDLSESFMREFADWLNWGAVSRYRNLSEEFMAEFADRLDWRRASEHQVMSDEFIGQHAERVDWSLISKKRRLGKALMKAHMDQLDWYAVAFVGKATGDNVYKKLVEKFVARIDSRVLVDAGETDE